MEKFQTFDPSRYADLAAIRKANPRISQRDRWRPTDPDQPDVWHLDGIVPGYGNMTIGWDFDAPPDMIDTFKLVAAILFTGNDPRYAHRTANTFRPSIKYLAAFMLANDYDTLGQLDESAFERFRSTLARTIARPSEHADTFIEALREQDALAPVQDDEDAEEDEERATLTQSLPDDRKATSDPIEGAPAHSEYGDAHGAVEQDSSATALTVGIVANRLYAWFFLKEARDGLAALDIAPAHNPFETASMHSIVQSINAKGLDDVEPLPDAVAIPILNAAAALLRTPANDVIRLQTAFLAIRQKGNPGYAKSMRLQRELATSFEFSPLEEGGPPWRDRLALKSPKSTGSLDLRRAIRRIHMAALTMLLAGTGVRISEACSVEVDDREVGDDLPSCVESRPSLSEQTEHFWLHGFLSKNQGRPRPEEWLLGARPQKAHIEPATLRAVRVLEELLQPWRRMATTPELRRQLQVSLGVGLPINGKAIRWIRSATLARLMADFFASLDLKTVLAEAAGNDERLRVYSETNGRCIHPHQWRHTYYEFMVRLDPRLLPAVSLHFKHTSLAATEIGYGSKDGSVREAKDSVRVQETVRSFTRRRFGKVAPVGRMAKELERERAALERMVGDIPGAEAEKRVEAFVIDQDIRIWPAEHGSCLMALNPTEAACRKVGGTVDFRANAPDLANRTPSLCCGCPNFSVGKENIPFWRRRYVEHRTAWIQSDRNPQFRVSLRHAAQAAAMLRALGEPIPLILRKPIPRPPQSAPTPPDDDSTGRKGSR